MKQLLYINFSPDVYRVKEELYKQQSHVFLYKQQLARYCDVHYILRSNFDFEEVHTGVRVCSVKGGVLNFLVVIRRYVRKNKIEVCIVHGLDYFLNASAIKLVTGCRVILQHHAEKTYLRKKAILMRFCDKLISAYFFNGKGLARPFVEGNFISGEKIFEVTEGTSHFEFLERPASQGPKKIVFVGRLNGNKNVFTILKALVLVASYTRDFVLCIYYTNNDQEKELKKFCDDNNLNELVFFKGALPNQDIQKVLSESDIFVSASLYEGSGYSLIEAMACGCYIIASRIPAHIFLLGGMEEKALFDPLNEQELAHHIKALVLKTMVPETFRSVRAHFQKRASAEAIANQITRVIESLPQ
ncbi:MAG: glycosyltransferase family 4 protein [Bacteroidia bacterium]|nr:glycosyltransferase family 4 protein [Bacteroidia bacterium]